MDERTARIRDNINHVVSRRAVHPVHEGIVQMENSPDGLTHTFRKMYVPRR